MSDCLLDLIVPPQVEDALAEWLLERDDVPGFSSMPVSGHGSSEHSMTLAEQVAGRSRRVMSFTHLPSETAHAVLDELAEFVEVDGLGRLVRLGGHEDDARARGGVGRWGQDTVAHEPIDEQPIREEVHRHHQVLRARLFDRE